MAHLEIGALYKVKEKIDWQIKDGPYQNGKFMLLFPSIAKTSYVDDVILILEEVKDDDHNEICLFGQNTYKVLIKNNEIVYMYTYTTMSSERFLEKII